MNKRALGSLIGSILFILACGDKAAPTQPNFPVAPPTPTPLPNALSMEVTLSPLTPPAGFKHAARAAIVVRELIGKGVTLQSIAAVAEDNFVHIPVSGFTSFRLGPNQTASFDVTLTAQDDIPCVYFGLDVRVIYAFDDGATNTVIAYGPWCDKNWLF